nr:ribonuclease H-like domain-containing protein [Tanacetum cinerariifolium]
MVAILEKTEHNTDFHQIVEFLEASHIRIETTDQETKIIATVDGKPRTISESSLRRHLKLNDEEGISSLPDAELFENLSLMGYNILPSQSNIATVVVCLATNRVYNFSKMIFDDEPTSLSRDDRHGEAFPTVSSLDAEQDRKNIAKTSAMSHESSPRVPSLDADEGSMKQRLHELMELCISLQRQQSQMADKIKDQDIEISGLKDRVKSLEDKEKRREEPIQEDALITGGIIDIGEKLGADKSTEKGGNDIKEMVNVLSSMEVANILSSRGATTASVSPADVFSTAGVPTVNGSFPTVSAIFTTASVVTPYTRRSRGITIRSLQPMRISIVTAKDKGKEKVNETEVPKKKKLQEQIDAQVAREIEEEFARENQRLSEQAARDSEIARIHAEEELKLMIEGLDRSNEVIAKHLSEYEQSKADLSKHMQDFVPMSSKEESERVKRPGIKLDQGSSKRVKISHTSRSEPSQEQQFKGSKGVSEEELKWMMQLVPLEEVYIEALQVKHRIIDWEIHTEGKRENWRIIRLRGHTGAYQFFVDILNQFDREDLHQLWILVKETFSIKQCTRDKEKELWVELKRLFEPDSEDQLWTYHQAFMHDPLDWKLYDTCGVRHVSTKRNQEIFMLVEKDYPLRKVLATVMINNKLQESLLGLILYRTPWPIKGVLRTWVLVPCLANVNVVHPMWIFKHKFHADGSLSSCTAQLVANRCNQQHGIVCDETFSLIVKLASIRTYLSLVVSRDWLIHHLDVKNAFLHGHLSETVICTSLQGLLIPLTLIVLVTCTDHYTGLSKPHVHGFIAFPFMLPELWKSRIKRYIDTKPNRELIHYCLVNPPYELGWKEKPILDAEGNPTNSTEKQSQELKHVSYHKLYDILKQHQHEVNEIRAKKIARVANPLALVAQQQQVYHPQTHPTHYNQHSSTRTHQAATRKREKAIVNSPQPFYDQEPSMVDDDDETSKEKEIDKLMALISLSFKKIYKPTNNNLRTSSNTSRAHQDNSPRIHRNTGYESQKSGNVTGA